VSSIQFDNTGKPSVYNQHGGNVMPFQDLAKGFAGVDASGTPIPVNPGKWQRGEVRVNPNGGVTQRVVVGGNAASFQAIEDRPQRFQASDLKSGEGIASSAIGAGGRHVAPYELKADSLVTIKLSDGTVTDTTVANAVSLNLLKPRQGGGYENVEPTQPQAQAQTHANAAQTAPAADALSTDVPVDEEYIGHAAVIQRGLPEVFVANAVNEMVKTGSFSVEAMNAAAKHLSTTPEAVLEAMKGAMDAHAASFERYVSANGIRPADFTAWLKGQEDTMALVMARQASTGRTSVWAPMLRQFKSSRGNR
jgi:hypothetical protein